MPTSAELGLYDSALSRKRVQRVYIGFTLCLVTLGFLIMALESAFIYSDQGQIWMETNPGAFTALTIVSFIASIAGCIMVCLGHERLAIAGAGYGLITLSLGFTTSIIVSEYDIASITSAFAMTCAYTGTMTCLGFLFPRFFEKIQGLLVACLLGFIVASLVGIFLPIPLGWLNWAILIVFGGFIGYDTYRMVNDEPTYANSIFWATQLYLDLVNVFIEFLRIFGNRRND